MDVRSIDASCVRVNRGVFFLSLVLLMLPLFFSFFLFSSPLAIGDRLWHRDSQTGMYHMDGAFSLAQHPTCQFKLGLPLSLDVYLNILNMNLGPDKVEKFWKAGLAHGL